MSSNNYKIWSQNVLPIVFDDYLQQKDLIIKLVQYVNGLLGDAVTLFNDFTSLDTGTIGDLEDLHTTEKGSVVGAINEVKDEITSVKADITYKMTTEMDWETQSLTLVTGKYLYKNGQVNTLDGRAYVMLPVPTSRKIKFSTFAQDTAWAIMYYNSSTPSTSSKVGTYEELTGNKTYTNEVVTIPDGVTHIGFNICNYTTTNYSMDFFEPTETAENLYDAGYATKTELEAVADDVADLSPYPYAFEQFKYYNGEFVEQTITPVTGKYVYGTTLASTSSGTVQTSADRKYAVIPVEYGDILAVTSLSQQYAPAYLYFKDSTINHSNLLKIEGAVTANVFNKDLISIVPLDAKYVVVNTSLYSEYPLVLKKFSGTESVPNLYRLTVNDLAHSPVDFIGSQISTFNKIVCIGDSLTAGGRDTPSVTPDSELATRQPTAAMYSYPTFINKMFGVETVNMGVSGDTSKQWYESHTTTDFGEYDAAILLLGNNDQRLVPTLNQSTLSTAQQLHKEAVDGIISLLRNGSHGIRIFICTLLPGWDQGNILTPYILSYARQLATENDDIFLVDMSRYSQIEYQTSAYSTGHCTGIGYQKMAKEIAGIINYTMNSNPDAFKWIPYIGTAYSTVFDN